MRREELERQSNARSQEQVTVSAEELQKQLGAALEAADVAKSE